MTLLRLSVAAALCGIAAQSRAAESAKPAASVKQVALLGETPKSFFAIGRNPFFPNLTPIIDLGVTNVPPVPKPPQFVLNGITSPPRRTAMINGRTFEAGEDADVKVSTGSKVRIKCLEIKDESALIEVDGKRIELRLRHW